MTRFLMSLEDSVNLVLYAFENGNNGDIFIQKLHHVLLKIWQQHCKNYSMLSLKLILLVHVMGRSYLNLWSPREEMAKSIDMGSYFRIPSDNRDLNYEKYISDGSIEASVVEDYTSHNTERLDIDGIKKILLKLDYIKKELGV